MCFFVVGKKNNGSKPNNQLQIEKDKTNWTTLTIWKTMQNGSVTLAPDKLWLEDDPFLLGPWPIFRGERLNFLGGCLRYHPKIRQKNLNSTTFHSNIESNQLLASFTNTLMIWGALGPDWRTPERWYDWKIWWKNLPPEAKTSTPKANSREGVSCEIHIKTCINISLILHRIEYLLVEGTIWMIWSKNYPKTNSQHTWK